MRAESEQKGYIRIEDRLRVVSAVADRSTRMYEYKYKYYGILLVFLSIIFLFSFLPPREEEKRKKSRVFFCPIILTYIL